jgi:hypothetical protein
MEKRKVADALETHLQSIRLSVHNLEEVQTRSELAAEYLDRSDPDAAIGALQTRISGTEEAIQFHRHRNQYATHGNELFPVNERCSAGAGPDARPPQIRKRNAGATRA